MELTASQLLNQLNQPLEFSGANLLLVLGSVTLKAMQNDPTPHPEGVGSSFTIVPPFFGTGSISACDECLFARVNSTSPVLCSLRVRLRALVHTSGAHPIQPGVLTGRTSCSSANFRTCAVRDAFALVFMRLHNYFTTGHAWQICKHWDSPVSRNA